VNLFFNERCTGVDLENSIAKFENQKTNSSSAVQSDLIFAADGAFSAGRLQLQLATDRFQYRQHYIEHGYKELNIPAGKNGEWILDKNVLHIWPRGGYMLIALPNMDGSFTCTLFFPFEGKESFSMLTNEKELLSFFNRVFPDAVPLMPTLTEDFFNNPTGSLVTVKCFPWSYKDKLCLIGDAAHAIVPFFGQGMNCGFEDCTVLQELMNENDSDWEKLFKAFENSRKPNSDSIADLALQNFIEMRDLVGDKKFLLRKKIEAWFHEKHPGKWLSLYSQVTFSAHIPYSAALANGKRQDEIMNKIMAMERIEERWNSEDVEKNILRMIG
jgi:kynurenine 3-monooxygenase